MDNFKQHLIEAESSLLTIRDFIRFMVSNFEKYKLSYGHGTNNAYDEAVYLTLSALHLPLDQLDPYFDAKLLKHEISAIINICEKRIIERLPAPYITHEANFLGYKFYVDTRVIIPRSYIAEIILDDGLHDFIEHSELVNNVLDLCTGNGSLAIIAADYFYESNVIASDINTDAIDVATINIKKYDLENVIELRQSNLFENLSDCKNKFDLIITNPPYVDDNVMEELPREYLHEPRISLSGGEDGLTLIDTILKNAGQYLNEFGILLLEMGNNKDALESQYSGLDFKWMSTKNGDGFVFVLTKNDLEGYFLE